MTKDIDIHNYDQKLNSIKKSIEKSEISKKNKELITDFENNCFSEGIGKAKITRYLYDLKKIAEILNKDFDVSYKEDMQRVLANLEKTDYAYSTKRGFRIVLKKFYKWLRKTDDIYPEEVRWIKTTAKIDKQRLPEDLLTEEDILRLIQNTNKLRDKAFIACLYESGCRIGEILTIKIKSVSFDEYGAKVSVFGKTGSRPVRLVSSASYLLEWINNGHPNNTNAESYVWISQKKELLSYGRIKDMLKDIAKRAGIQKAINPHSFRHARATILAKKLSDAQLKSVMGWTQGSKMSAIYVHLSQRDTDDAILEINGIKREEQEKSKIELKECVKCKHKSKPTSKFCELCGMSLNKEEAYKIIKSELDKSKINNFMNELSKDPEFMEMIKKKLNQ